MASEDDIIWEGIRRKDEKVFSDYYLEHHREFFVLACRYLEDPAMASETINDIFLKLWERSGEISTETSLKAYIYRAISNRCLNIIRDRGREAKRRSKGPLPPASIPESIPMEEQELSLQLYRAIDDLPEQCGKVFRMSRFENLKQQQIADQLGISLKTVKNHMTHALKRLHQVFKQSLPLLIAMTAILFLPDIGPTACFGVFLISMTYGPFT